MRNLNRFIKEGLEHEYDIKIDKLLVHPDPKVEGTYAIRVYVKDSEAPMDFLLVHAFKYKTAEEAGRNMDECEWETWPPDSGELKFF